MPSAGKSAEEAAFYFCEGIILHLRHIQPLNFLHSIWYLQSSVCMQSEFYPFQSDDDQLYFEFVRISFERTIRKAVLFTEFPHSNGLFNLALLDVLPNGELSDIASPENNLDLEKAMSTVSECLRIFLERYPYAEIKIQGNTPAKSRLYRMVLGKELSNIQK